MSSHPDPTPPRRRSPPAPEQPALPEQGSTVSAWHRLRLMARPRATRANAFAALLAVVLGFAVATQVRSTQSQGLESLRQTDLVGILDDVTQQSDPPGRRRADAAGDPRPARQRLQQRGGGAQGGPGPAGRAADPGRYGARHGARASG